MKKYIVIIFALLFAALIPSVNSFALSGSDFNAGRIIDDAVFYNSSSMTVGQMQQFLNSKVPTCDTNGTKTSEYGGGTRAQWAASISKPFYPPFTCLKDYSQTTPNMSASSYCNAMTASASAKSSAQIIYDVSVACGINPQVMLVLLQKEQALIFDEWPSPGQYTMATGYACPDTAACDPAFGGFFYQIYYAAKQYKLYRANPNSYGYVAGRNNTIMWTTNAACGSSQVYIENQATAGLYNYTPYRPNQAALNNLYGEGDSCSSYGNRNFWRYFSDWFGSTVGPNYAWTIESYNYSGGDNTFAPGVTETATLKARNTGRYPWYNHGDNPVRLGTWEPADSSSGLYNSGWQSRTRLATLTESVVMPGETGTFQFPITAPAVGTFYQSLNLVAENSAWMSWTGFRPTLIGASPYSWSPQSILYGNGTGLMKPGEKQLITVTAKNTGTATWNKSSGPPIILSTWSPDRQSLVASDWINNKRVTLMNEASVAPGATAGFQFYVTIPRSGYFYEKLNLVAEGQSWFNDEGLTLYLQGGSYKYQTVWTSISTGSTTFSPGQEFTLTAKVKNTGDYSWGANTRLATFGPMNRGSNFYNSSSWINDIRLTSLIETTVSPGQEGTFSVKLKAPQKTGSFYEEFNIVAEGQAWYESAPIVFRFNVK